MLMESKFWLGIYLPYILNFTLCVTETDKETIHCKKICKFNVTWNKYKIYLTRKLNRT